MNLPGWHWLPAILTAAVIFGLSHQPELPPIPGGIPDWLAHLLEYGFFTLTLVFATSRGFRRELRTVTRVAGAVLIAALYGITDELHQSFVPGRDPALTDWLADVAGAVIVATSLLVLWRRMAAPQDRL